MFLECYKIEGTKNNDQNPCFSNPDTDPNFQNRLVKFKSDLVNLVEKKESKTFFKFGDGDYFFLKAESVGSAGVGKRAISVNYNQINHQDFVQGSKMNDYYTCEIYPENRRMFSEVLPGISIDYPAEYGYGLVSNKWFFKTFKGRIGLIGADKKIDLIQELMGYKEYQEYLGIESFNDYIKIPQKFACDDIESTEKMVATQLENSTSDIFLFGIGHVKSALSYKFKKYKKSIFYDIGSGIDAIAGVIDIDRPYFGEWTNYQIKNSPLYNEIDYLAYQGKGNHIIL
jgi:hypothetical protein